MASRPARTPRKRGKPRKPPGPAKPVVLDGVRDRVVELRRVPVAELLDNEKNWRVHPYAQRRAISESLQRIGIAGALTAYHSPRNGGKLTLIDGHGRREENDELEWPTLILDVDDDEADLLLLTLDPIAALAGADSEALNALVASAGQTGLPALEDLVRSLQMATNEALLAQHEAAAAGEPDPEVGGPPEMELQPFESYEYVVVLFRSSLDWSQAQDKLGIGPAAFTLRDGKTRKVGLGRVVDGTRLLGLLK